MSVLTVTADTGTTALLTQSQAQEGSPPASFLALDPGGTTGWCLARWLPENNRIVLSCGQNQWSLYDLYTAMMAVSADDSPFTIIYESFEYRNKARAGLNLIPVKLIGVIELLGQLDCGFRMYSQNAAQGKGFYSDDKLKKMELYQVGDQHGRDATRHMLHFFTFGAGVQWIGDIDRIEIDLVDIEWLASAYYPSWMGT